MRRLIFIPMLVCLPALADGANGERGRTERWADRCTNFTTTTWAFKAPDNFLKWLDVYSDPAIYVEYARRSLDPDYVLRGGQSLLDAGTARNFLEWADPAIPAKWAGALAQPEFYGAVSAMLFDPGRAMRWAMLPVDPKLWRAAASALAPDTWAKWLALPANPLLAEILAKAQDPITADEWLRELQDPGNYPFLAAPHEPRPSP